MKPNPLAVQPGEILKDCERCKANLRALVKAAFEEGFYLGDMTSGPVDQGWEGSEVKKKVEGL